MVPNHQPDNIYIYIPYNIIWATVNIWYIAPSHQFLKSVLSFFRFWHISKYYCFLMSVLSFSKPQLNFQKIETARILLSINLDFGCSSYNYHTISSFYRIFGIPVSDTKRRAATESRTESAFSSKIFITASELESHGQASFIVNKPHISSGNLT